MKWLRKHGSGFLEKVLATLAAAGALYVLSLVPKVGPLLRTPLSLPVWLLLSIPVAFALVVLLYRRNRPWLQIDYEGTEANKISVERKQGNESISEIYIRARVRNTGRVARGCRVFLTARQEVHPSGATPPTPFHDSMMMVWTGWNFLPRDVPRGISFYVDVRRIFKQSSGWLFSVEKPFASRAGLKDYRGTYRFCLTVTGDNAEPATCQIDVTYAGDWHNLRACRSPLTELLGRSYRGERPRL